MFGPVNVKNTNLVVWPSVKEIEVLTRSMLEKMKINRVDVGLDDKGNVLGALKFYTAGGATSGVTGKWPPGQDVIALPASTVDPDGSIR